ncbi:acyl carrier protein [Micromonospora sp. WMMD980]|uniref:acyl carrier protein n=1 Tax=Micromonospora sp. WMMD980 TaxID=3016088 RepID=UPI00241599CC|nr:acyl carrier protein [Micromonospora sp. WMMD980]MDG4803219.1 acyl carrier protein [Micromonospora sp. WMMD980]
MIENPTNQHQVSEPAVLDALLRTATEALELPVTANDDLFDLGLDSLSALEICATMEDQFPLECFPEDVFEHPVPVDLARHLSSRSHTT